MFGKKDKKVNESANAGQKSSISESEAKKALNSRKKQAEELLHDETKMDDFLSQLDKKFNAVTGIKDKLADIPIIVQLIKDYMSGRYKEFPLGSLIALVGALLYFLSPVDLIPDTLPGIGYLDDITVLGIAIKFAYTDLEAYKEWLAKNK